jgi:large subunit ribosomal protein L13
MNLLQKNKILDWTLNKNIFSKSEHYIKHWFLIDAKNETLGRLATKISQLLRGKEFSNFNLNSDQSNNIIVINALHIFVTGKKKKQKFYYRNSRRPGSLKVETYFQLQNRIPTRILEKAIWKMLPKGRLINKIFKRLYIFPQNNFQNFLTDKKKFQKISFKNFWKFL